MHQLLLNHAMSMTVKVNLISQYCRLLYKLMPAVSSDILWSNLEKCFHHYNNYIYIYIVATNVIVFFVF